MVKDNIIQQKSFDFALEIITLYKYLKENNEFILSRQILRSATSV
jgi:four helix bundle protein